MVEKEKQDQVTKVLSLVIVWLILIAIILGIGRLIMWLIVM